MHIVPLSSQITNLAKTGEQLTNQIQNNKDTNLFSDIFKNAVNNLQETEKVSQQDAYNLSMGKIDDLHTVAINTEKYTTALELTVQMTTKAVNAYNEIMRMQI